MRYTNSVLRLSLMASSVLASLGGAAVAHAQDAQETASSVRALPKSS